MLKVNSGTDQEVWGVYIDFQSIHSEWMIVAILQHTPSVLCLVHEFICD